LSNEHDLFTGIINVIDQGQPTEDKDSVASALAAANERYENMRKDLVKCMNAVHEQNREMLETALEKVLGENRHFTKKMEDETGKVSILSSHMWRHLPVGTAALCAAGCSLYAYVKDTVSKSCSS